MENQKKFDTDCMGNITYRVMRAVGDLGRLAVKVGGDTGTLATYEVPIPGSSRVFIYFLQGMSGAYTATTEISGELESLATLSRSCTTGSFRGIKDPKLLFELESHEEDKELFIDYGLSEQEEAQVLLGYLRDGWYIKEVPTGFCRGGDWGKSLDAVRIPEEFRNEKFLDFYDYDTSEF